MKKLLVLTLAGFLCIATAQAGVDFVGVDGVQTDYTAATGVLLMDDSGLVVTVDYDDGSSQGSVSPASFNLNTTFDSGMHFSGGTFAFTDNSGGGSSVIISGNVIGVDFAGAGGFLVGSGTAEVQVSNLAGYPVGVSDVVSLTFSLSPAFTDFNQSYTGLSKVNFLVPEPATLAILGLGGLMLLRRRV